MNHLAPRNYRASEVPINALRNFGTDSASILQGLVQSVPALARGAVETGKRFATLQPAVTDAEIAHGIEMAKQVPGYIANRYGSWENFKRTVAEHPAGFLMDLASVVSGGAGVASKVGRAGSLAEAEASRVASLARPRMNPLAESIEAPVSKPVPVAPVVKSGPMVIKAKHGTSHQYLQQVRKQGGQFTGFRGAEFADNMGPEGAMYLDTTPEGQESVWQSGGAARMPSYDTVADVETQLNNPFVIRNDQDVIRLHQEMGLPTEGVDPTNIERWTDPLTGKTHTFYKGRLPIRSAQGPASAGFDHTPWKRLKGLGYDGIVVSVEDPNSLLAEEAFSGNHQTIVFDPEKVRLQEHMLAEPPKSDTWGTFDTPLDRSFNVGEVAGFHRPGHFYRGVNSHVAIEDLFKSGLVRGGDEGGAWFSEQALDSFAMPQTQKGYIIETDAPKDLFHGPEKTGAEYVSKEPLDLKHVTRVIQVKSPYSDYGARVNKLKTRPADWKTLYDRDAGINEWVRDPE